MILPSVLEKLQICRIFFRYVFLDRRVFKHINHILVFNLARAGQLASFGSFSISAKTFWILASFALLTSSSTVLSICTPSPNRWVAGGWGASRNEKQSSQASNKSAWLPQPETHQQKMRMREDEIKEEEIPCGRGRSAINDA